MTFRYEVEITTKNNQLTRDTSPADIATLIQREMVDELEAWVADLPWIVQLSVKEVRP